jgi:hypothetical protein
MADHQSLTRLPTRTSSCVLGALTLFVGSSCIVDQPTTPEAVVAEAKGGKPGKPGGGTEGAAPVLEEYWVYTGTDGAEYLHVVAHNADRISMAGVAHDHFFNGWVDSDPPVELHYEPYYPGTGAPDPQLLPDGRVHVDIPFEGRRGVDSSRRFPRFLTTAADDQGRNPFAFYLAAYLGTDVVGRWAPGGVVIEGQESEVHAPGPIAAIGHESPFTDVRSYARVRGPEPAGTFWIEQLTFEDIQCRTETIREGRGREATVRTTTIVSGTLAVLFGRSDGGTNAVDESIWWEAHLVTDDGYISPRLATTRQGATGVAFAGPENWSGGSAEVVVDLAHAFSGPGTSFENFAYDPMSNRMTTTLGMTQQVWSNPTEAMPRRAGPSYGAPFARSAVFEVACT